jgi:hypothetical protein
MDEVGPAEDEGEPGNGEEGGVVAGGGEGGGDDDAEEAKGDVEEVVAEADALGLFGFEFVVFEESDFEDGAFIHGIYQRLCDELFGDVKNTNKFSQKENFNTYMSRGIRIFNEGRTDRIDAPLDWDFRI